MKPRKRGLDWTGNTGQNKVIPLSKAGYAKEWQSLLLWTLTRELCRYAGADKQTEGLSRGESLCRPSGRPSYACAGVKVGPPTYPKIRRLYAVNFYGYRQRRTTAEFFGE